MKTDLSPLTMEKRNYFPWTVYNTGTQFSLADNLDFGLEFKTVDLKPIDIKKYD